MLWWRGCHSLEGHNSFALWTLHPIIKGHDQLHNLGSPMQNKNAGCLFPIEESVIKTTEI
jgi:hypothetical protein